MKKLLLLIVYVLSIHQYLQAQICAPNGITTNPVAPVNNQKPSKINTFNWLQTDYSLRWIYNSVGSIKSPFYQTDNSITNHFVDSKDMYPGDGWELIKKDFGYQDNGQPSAQPVSNPYLVLYNKYTGILRVFVARGDMSPFNGASLQINFILNSPMQTSLLDQTRELVAINAPFVRDPIIASASNFNNESQRWFYADFPMTYDPCTCNYQSKLLIKVALSNTSKISLAGSTAGELVSQAVVNPEASAKSSFSIGDAKAVAKKAKDSFKTVDKFRADTEKAITASTMTQAEKDSKKVDLTKFQELVKKSDFLKAGLAAAPYIGAAVSLLDLFIGGGKKSPAPQAVLVHPMSIKMTSKFTGEIGSEYTYKDITFWNPGSNNTSFDANEYPYYNEVMGIFNLLETPIVKAQTDVTITPDRYPRDSDIISYS